MPRKEKDRDQLITERCCLLARQECCNYYKGLCLTDDGKCHLIGPYPTIHDGKIDCDWFLKAVLPQDKELSVYVWKEILRDETLYEDDEIVPVPEEVPFRHCAICGKEFIPAFTTRNTALFVRQKENVAMVVNAYNDTETGLKCNAFACWECSIFNGYRCLFADEMTCCSSDA